MRDEMPAQLNLDFEALPRHGPRLPNVANFMRACRDVEKWVRFKSALTPMSVSRKTFSAFAA